MVMSDFITNATDETRVRKCLTTTSTDTLGYDAQHESHDELALSRKRTILTEKQHGRKASKIQEHGSASRITSAEKLSGSREKIADDMSANVIPVREGNTVKMHKLDMPEWDKEKSAWGFLQSLNPKYDSMYLDRQGCAKTGRTGYLFGRCKDADIRFESQEISKRHCVIYMETGNSSHGKGICIYLKDMSSNGTFVNGSPVGADRRVMLKAGDRIQLYHRDGLAEDDSKLMFYRILFPPVFEVGSFDDSYVADKKLGEGYFATVFHAQERNTGKCVAVKRISKSRFNSGRKLLHSILQEISILMSLEPHPCVIQIEKVFHEPKHIYMVLELVEGGELFDYVTERQMLTEPETRFVTWQLLSAIKFLHDRSIAHRDLKPENVLLVDKETLHIKITDFGLAKLERQGQRFFSQCGTPNYVAPEVLNPNSIRAYGKECDMWSLGVMFYICLCGYPPFNEENPSISLRDQIKNGIYDFPVEPWEDISPYAIDLVERLLKVNPKERATVKYAKSHPWMVAEREKLREMAEAVSPTLYDTLEVASEDPLVMTQTQSCSFTTCIGF
ncbi:kinase-like domain-containing protein [Radiomyces spectabilis]|uniref:kinase-like domain-containing protein n=1 Tax=Radiomyces spectabilis TaxID=64574 RepID=UPI00222034F7|nr:kinase-like domain-containing protein [Radiomyces spectabilis]KAI8372871.1 kinase-like domain-containing protein [Radiomyces spectabilis]